MERANLFDHRYVNRGARRFRDQINGLLFERRARREIDAWLIDYAGDGPRPLPDFLVIGAPKCATSWLSKALRQQPNIDVVPDEIEYFSSHLERPLQWYLEHFERLLGVTKPGQKLIGEKSAGYCGLSPARIRLVHRLLPDARLILMIRDPVVRHWSHAKRFFSKRKARNRGFHSLESPAQLHRFFLRTRRFGEFSRMIENWTDVYPAEHLLVVRQEAALADPRAICARVMRHIGIFDFGPDLTKQVLRKKNRGPSISMPSEVSAYLERMFAGERERLAKVVRARFPSEAISEILLP